MEMQHDVSFLPRGEFHTLLTALEEAGYRCAGPQVRDGAILYDTLESVGQLPKGIQNRQAPGHYRLDSGASPRCFAWANGPQALKPMLFAPRELLWRAGRDPHGGLHFESAVTEVAAQKHAVIGVRACDLAALQLHDQHFLQKVRDPGYAARRRDLFLVAVHCTHPADTCFCVSTGDGPRVTQGCDVVLSELDEGYLLAAGSDVGRTVLGKLPLQPAREEQLQAADREVEAAAARQHRSLPSRNLREALFSRLDHPRWHEVAERCLSCGNCVNVCPTCFCHAEKEVPDLDGTSTAHYREWDSCFTSGHSLLHGEPLRTDIRTRYRQWLTHKLGSWHDQYGRSGCVGCGRCVTWCPVGIDITEEATAICTDPT